MKIILIGNYRPDRQESMERFARMLCQGFLKEGVEAEIWQPWVVFGKFARTTTSGLGKWLGYLDKWALFPLVLRWKLLSYKSLHHKDARFHICDHSNAPYLAYLPKERTAITCHDVLAIRGAIGYKDAYCPASPMGKVLQQWILRNLKLANKLAAVSAQTLQQLRDLTADKVAPDKDWQVIYNAFNADFKPVLAREAIPLLQKAGLDLDRPYLLHVGSALPRKNRKLLVDMLHLIRDEWPGVVCFAGQPLDEALLTHIRKLQLEARVQSVVKPDHQTLLALYSSCEVFIFPSFSEGFGWPLIEAQACGAPVIASAIAPLPEVTGGVALHADPYDAKTFAEAFFRLQDTIFKNQLIQKAYKNCERFLPERMIAAYGDLHTLPMKNLHEQPV